MPWQLYLLISILLISCNGLFHRSLMKDDKSHPIAQTIVFLGLGGCIAIIIALLQRKLQLSFPPSLGWNFLLLILLSTPAYLLTYRAYQLLGASEIVLLLSTGRLWNVMGAALFLHEAITTIQVLGALIILAGLAITLYDKRKFTVNKGVLFVLLAAFLYGMSDINGYYMLHTLNATNFLIYSEFLPVIVLLIMQPTVIKNLRYYFHTNTATKALLLSFCDALGSLALFLSYQAGGKASVIGPLSATRVLVTVVLAMVILRERNNIRNKILGAIITICGVILLL